MTLALATILWLSIQQGPPKFPRVSPQSSAHIAQKNEGAKAGQQYPEHSPPSPSATIGETPSNDPQRSAQNINPDIDVEREVAEYTLALVIVGIFTATFIGWQSYETRKSAKAMQRSAHMQEIALQQWLALEGWRIENVDPPRGIPNRFDIAVELINPTAAPVTLGEYEASISGFPPYLYIGENVLGPSQPYKLTVPVILSDEQKKACERYTLSLTIRGRITYKDASGTTKFSLLAKHVWLVVTATPGLSTGSP